MEISIFGYALIIVSLIMIYRKRKSIKSIFAVFFALSIISGIFLDLGYFAKIGDFYIEYNYYFSFLAFFFAVVYLLFGKVSKVKWQLFGFLLLFLVAISIIKEVSNISYLSTSYDGIKWDNVFLDGKLEYVFPKTNFQYLIRFIMYIMIIIAASTLRLRDYYKIARTIFSCSLLYLVYLLLEVVFLNFLDSNVLRDISFFIFGNSINSITTARRFAFIWAPMGFAREPSNLSFTIWYILINNILLLKLRKKSIVSPLIIIYLLLMLISSSFGGIMHFISIVLLIIMLIYEPKNRSKIILFLMISLAILLVISSSFANRFENIITYAFNFKADSVEGLPVESTIIRLYSIFNNMYYFLAYPITGTGLGSIYSFSAIITLLTNFGLFGFILFLMLCTKNAKSIVKSKAKFVFFIPIIISFSLTGHIGYIIFYEKTFYIFVIIMLAFKLKRREHYHYGKNLRVMPVANC